MVRRLLVLMILLAVFLGEASGQVEKKYWGQGYFFTGFGKASGYNRTTEYIGGGAEALIEGGLGASAELGYLSPVGVFSANGSYYLLNPQSGRKVLPFVTAGYTLMFRDERANMFNAGGGANIWFSRHVGVRLEFRDHVQRYRYRSADHCWNFRTGVVLR